MRVTIYADVPSLNKLLRMHWAKRRRLCDDVQAEITAMHGLPLPSRRRVAKSVRIMSYRKRLLDKDNLTGGAKPIVDALKLCGFIWDDSPEWIELHVDQAVDAKRPRTEIEVSQVGRS